LIRIKVARAAIEEKPTSIVSKTNALSNQQRIAPIRAGAPSRSRPEYYREAFNHAFAAHAGEAHRVAWAAVKCGYVKADENWMRRHP
jgi:cation transport regulator